jgi:hypothetical protein
MLLHRVLAPVLLAISPLALADSVDINMNNTSAQIKAGISASGIGDGNAELQARVLYNDTNDILADAGVFARGPGGGEEGEAGPIAGGGLKVLAATLHQPGATYNLACITLGGEFGYALPSSMPIAVVGEYLASPKILSFSDAERFNQYGVRLELAASPKAKIYLGYREVGFGIKNAGSVIFDKGTHVGLFVAF